VWLTLGMNQAETSGYAAGESALAAARDLAIKLDESGLAVVVNGQSGLMAMRAGQFEHALNTWTRQSSFLSTLRQPTRPASC
jgi:hypothetical protein